MRTERVFPKFMMIRKTLIFIVGFAGSVVPGWASLSYYTGSSQPSSFTSAVSGMAGLGLETFVPGPSGFSGLVYQDGTTLTDFNGCATASCDQTDSLTVATSTNYLVQAANAYVEV